MSSDGVGILIILVFIICLHTCEINQKVYNIDKQLKQTQSELVLKHELEDFDKLIVK